VFSLRKSLDGADFEVAAALHVDGRTELAGASERPFRIASITKSFTATALWEAGLFDERVRALLSHTAGYRPETPSPLPPECDGLWSYSNAGYWEAASLFGDYSEAVRSHVLGTLPDDVVADPSYPASRRPSGGLWSTVGDLVTYGLAHCRSWTELHEPVADALGAQYACGWWVRDGVLDHEGSVGGYQSLLLIVPERELVLAVLTNSWRGSTAIRRVVNDLGVVRLAPALMQARDGTYALDAMEAIVEDGRIVERETDPLSGRTIERRYPFSADATLMSWRSDFPRDGVARIGWTALPRVA
jgi:CubicO group peptidase (beta-lactamase class C family)